MLINLGLKKVWVKSKMCTLNHLLFLISTVGQLIVLVHSLLWPRNFLLSRAREICKIYCITSLQIILKVYLCRKMYWALEKVTAQNVLAERLRTGFCEHTLVAWVAHILGVSIVVGFHSSCCGGNSMNNGKARINFGKPWLCLERVVPFYIRVILSKY